MSIGGVLTGGLAPGSSGVSFIPTWGLTPGVARSPTRLVSLRAAGPTPLALRAAGPSPLTLPASPAMPAPTGHAAFYQGEAVSLRFAVTDSPATAGWAMLLTIFTAAGATALAVAATADSPTTGTVSVTLTHAQTAALAVGPYRYELHRTDSGSETMMSAGSIDVRLALIP